MELFGFEIRKRQAQERKNLDEITTPVNDDGALIVAEGGSYGTVVDMEGAAKNEGELVTKYREMSLHPEVESAIDDIVNEAIVVEDDYIVKLNLDKIEYEDNIKEAISSEFQSILSKLSFTHQAYDIFKRWYIDGRMYYHIIIDKDNPQEGIQELRYIDPRKIKKVRETKRKKIANTNVSTTQQSNEYYIYSERGFGGTLGNSSIPATQTAGVKIAKDSIIYCTSGLLDKSNTLVLGNLHKAIKPLNNLRALEDATVIYRIARAPERRIFYIDVGNLPKMKAEQYLRDMMVRHKNRVVYDASTGEVRDDRKFMTMLEDYWLPRREGSRGTQIETLPGGQNLGEMTDVEYFKKALYAALSVPASRMQSEPGFNLGRSSEISRDEVKFNKFINRLRSRFNHLFLKALEIQLVLKGIITKDDWKNIAQNISFMYTKDNYFSELKEIEIMTERFNTFQTMLASGAIGKYYSNKWARTYVFRQTEEEMKEMDEEIQKELDNPQYYPPAPPEVTQQNEQ